MRKGEVANEVESRYVKEELEDPTVKICSVFPSTIPDGTIQVLVVVPKIGSKRPAEDERIGEVLKILRTKESDYAAIKANLATIKVDLATIKADLAATKPKTFTDFKNLSVREDEFRLETLYKTRQSDDPIVMAPTLHKFCKGFGEFPPYYFVRMEEVVFWKVIKKLLFGKDRVVIVGSPGVGKSCFLMLIAFYLACIKGEKVLFIRRLKQRKRMNTVVFFYGRGSYARLSNLSSQDIKAVRDQAQGAFVLVDGFDQAEVEDSGRNYMPFDLLATSCQFDAKPDDESHIVVLPAWRVADLQQYAKLTNWVVDIGLCKIKRQDTPLSKLVKEQYFYSGGSMREFCKKRELLKKRSRSQEDGLRRHYITDCHEEEHYYNRIWWKLSVDSGYVLSQLGRIVDTDKQLEVYKYAKSAGAGFHGVTYEQLLHNAVHGAFAKRKPIVLKMRDGSKYEKIEMMVRNIVCSGVDEASCYPCLSTLGKDTYWHRNYPFFPFIDAVTTCKAFRSGSENPDTIVAYVQVTIQREKRLKKERLHRLNEEMDKNPSLKGMKRAFVVVGPDFDVCDKFVLHDAPDTFPAMVGCFSPEQLEPEVS
ncbi:hypothetical protein PF008_g12666 [Phytophthora fragariae]|uniref:Crinkler (CRN) family protein n=2 Tax=Phytophthora fragariae TaxID=53985 RepID=A0A6G0RMQ8_9STRA|nr:hypothetical protein PF008_g12666 [Phytophthora fragariae]